MIYLFTHESKTAKLIHNNNSTLAIVVTFNWPKENERKLQLLFACNINNFLLQALLVYCYYNMLIAHA